MVTVNGQEENVAGQTVIDFLKQRNAPVDNIVVERNGEIVHRAEFDQVTLAAGDKVELISFVGGG
ncbi:sulfur carrier protein ThiS [Lentilactobacillus raoultii]|uniref:Sulfur carrier protein ThiS n=1 Tax=Lentilactobacillus raoultii TaxID=1987503 RepID=A0ABW3PQ24_9LACO|nr:sulfur carrier protein ThiS [Lentilactobacillus raoultii]